LIFGATGAIGAALSRKLIARGDHVLLAARDPDRLGPLAEELAMPSVICDSLDAGQIGAAYTAAIDRWGRLDGVANCVGSVLLKPAHLTSAEEFSQTIALNLTSAFHAVHQAAKTMKSGGSVVLFSSAAARIGLANHEAIAAAKAGVEGLARSAAATYAARGLRFNCLAPGLVKSRITERIWSNAGALQASQSMHPLGAPAEPEWIAEAAAWLLSPAQPWITGQTIAVDGGLSGLKTLVRPN
jgi:NAD(P)-dependent dehydrogenase (short-subunit alcohol dehydrogenase family)